MVRPLDDTYYLTDRIGSVDGRAVPERDAIQVAWNATSPGYFATIGTPLLLGRDFDRRDDGAAGKVVMVNETLARQALPGQNPIGHRIEDAEIVGVVKDALYAGAREQPRAVLYRPLFQMQGSMNPSAWTWSAGVSFELRYGGSIAMDDVQRAVAAVDPHVPIFRVKTLAAQTDDSLLRERLLATLSTVFGGLALLLACLGLYGLMAYAVTRRTGEIGIRMALGAPRAQIVWLTVRGALALVCAGAAIGLPVSVRAARYARTLLFGLTTSDPWVMAVSMGALLAVAAIAGYLPSRRASRVDPMAALRYE